MEAAIDFPPLTREKLDRLTVKRTAKFEAQGYSVDQVFSPVLANKDEVAPR
jgi:hypothetical protein